nr:sialate O-acetylesterase [Escherichia coli]
PEYYYVIALAGQSNGMSYGEGLPLPDTFDSPDPRIKQLARRSTVTPGGAACTYNDIIPADHCLHDVQDMSSLHHPNADLSKGQYGCVGQGLHIAKKLLAFIPKNAGILLVPCCRGGSAFTSGAEGAFSESSGATAESSLWGVGKPLYNDLLTRTKAALDKNPKNVLLSVVWMLGEFDLKSATYAQHPQLFLNMVNQFRADLSAYSSQCTGGNASFVPWICGDTTYLWKQKYTSQYPVVYGAYQNKEAQKIYFVPLMTDEKGTNTPTNLPAEDPDLAEAGYYGAASRSNGNWTSSDRATHFSSWARRGIVSDRLATAILMHAGKTAAFLKGTPAPFSVVVAPPATAGSDSATTESPQPSTSAPQPGAGTQPSPEVPPATETPARTTAVAYRADTQEGKLKEQGWTGADGKASVVDDSAAESGKAMRVEKVQGQQTAWKIAHDVPASKAAELLQRGGEIAFRFKIPEGVQLATNRFAMALYWPVSQLPENVVLEGCAGNDMLAAFFIQSDSANLNLMQHKQQNAKLGTFGAFNHNWHNVVFRFAGNNSISVTPVINGQTQAAFNLAKCPAAGLDNDKLLLTDITSNQDTYPVLIEHVTVAINNSNAA